MPATFAKGAAAAGVTNLLADPAVQMAQIRMGTLQQFDPAQTFIGAAGGAFLGGTLNISPEVAGRIAKVVGDKLGKAADRVTNSDVWQAMSEWVRRPDTMPDELKIEPRFLSAPDAPETVPASQGPHGPFSDLVPASPVYREHVVPPQTEPAREPTYKGGILGEPFALPSRKPVETETPKTEVPQSQEPLGFHAVEDTNRSSVKDVGVFA